MRTRMSERVSWAVLYATGLFMGHIGLRLSALEAFAEAVCVIVFTVICLTGLDRLSSTQRTAQ